MFVVGPVVYLNKKSLVKNLVTNKQNSKIILLKVSVQDALVV